MSVKYQLGKPSRIHRNLPTILEENLTSQATFIPASGTRISLNDREKCFNAKLITKHNHKND
jgi:hypothetical protein